MEQGELDRQLEQDYIVWDEYNLLSEDEYWFDVYTEEYVDNIDGYHGE